MSTINIYSPIYHRFAKTKIAIESVISSLKNSEHDVKLFLGVNGIEGDKNGEMFTWLNSLDSDNVKVFYAKKNIGKAAIINEMYKNTRKAEYFISIDSDMEAIHEAEYNWIDEGVKTLTSNEQFGVLSTFQEGNNCHLLDKQNSKIGTILYGTFWGIAGGCIFLTVKDFERIGLYTVYDVYNGDDAFIMRKCKEILRKEVGITSNVSLKHIENYENEDRYQEWKIKKCTGQLPCGSGAKGYYD